MSQARPILAEALRITKPGNDGSDADWKWGLPVGELHTSIDEAMASRLSRVFEQWIEVSGEYDNDPQRFNKNGDTHDEESVESSAEIEAVYRRLRASGISDEAEVKLKHESCLLRFRIGQPLADNLDAPTHALDFGG